MARTVLLSTLRTWARRLADVENDPNITDAELTDLANRHLTEVWDLLVQAGPPEYYAATQTITTSPGTATYALAADFRSLLYVYANETIDVRRPVLPMGEGERGRYKAPTGAWDFTVEYVPAAPILSDGGTNTFDGVSGWEELIAKLMARDVMTKREADTSATDLAIMGMKSRITSARGRNLGSPKRVVDLDACLDANWPWGWTSNVRASAYRLRGANLELFEPLSGLPQ